MIKSRLRRTVIIIIISLILFFTVYSYIFRNYLDPELYIQLAWEHTGFDPHILNPREPRVNVLFEDGRILIHMIYHTDQDREIGPYSFYIDPFKMTVVSEDPRVPTGN